MGAESCRSEPFAAGGDITTKTLGSTPFPPAQWLEVSSLCAGLFLAVFDSTVSVSIPEGSEMTVWPVSYAWIHLAIGIDCRTCMIGDGHRFSCGRTSRSRQGS